MRKLTKAQAEVLHEMASDTLCFLGGCNPRHFWLGAITGRSPSSATVHALHKAGLIVQRKIGVGSFDYALTPAGRALLASEPST